MKTMANELKETLDLFSMFCGSEKQGAQNFLRFEEDSISFAGQDVFLKKQLETEITGCVDCLFLQSVIDKHATSEVELYREENELVVKHKRSVSRLLIQDVSSQDCPFKDTVDENSWRKLPADFYELIGEAINMTSANYNEPAKTCVRISKRFIEASDGFKLGIYKMRGHIQDELFIRRDFGRALTKFKAIGYSLTDSWICFRNEAGCFLAIKRILIPDYPNLQDIFETFKNEQIEVEFPERTINSLERADLFLQDEFEIDKNVSLEISGGKISLSTRTKRGSYKDRFSGPDSAELKIRINPANLIKMLYFSNKVCFSETGAYVETANVKLASALMED